MFHRMPNSYNWKYPDIDINAAPAGVVSQVVENLTPEGEHFGTNRLAIFQDMTVIHNHYATARPLEKRQHINNCQSVIDIIQIAGGFNGHFTPPGGAVNVPFDNSVMVANFTCTQPHGLSFGSDSELYMNHVFLRHDQLSALANRYPDQLERMVREVEALDRDVVLGGGIPGAAGRYSVPESVISYPPRLFSKTVLQRFSPRMCWVMHPRHSFWIISCSIWARSIPHQIVPKLLKRYTAQPACSAKSTKHEI